MYLGDYFAGDTIYFKFTTVDKTTPGAPIVLTGTPAISVYKNGSTTQSTAGVALTASFDSVTGMNHVEIDTSADGTFYAAGGDFDVVITTGTIDGVSAVGYVVGRFTLQRSAAYRALVSTTFAEPSSVPAATSSLKDKIGWLFALSRNKITQTSTTQTLRNDGDSGTIGAATVSDSAGTTTRGKFV